MSFLSQLSEKKPQD